MLLSAGIRVPQYLSRHCFHVSQCHSVTVGSQVTEKEKEKFNRKELSYEQIALEQLRTKTFGGYEWEDISRRYRKTLFDNKVKSLIKAEERKQKPEEAVKVLRPSKRQRILRREREMQAMASSKLRVAVDCEWGETNSPKENVLLVKQLVEMDRINRLAPQPAKLFLTGIHEGGRIYQEGYKRAKKGGLSAYLFSDITPRSIVEYFSKEEIVYLSPDAPQTLFSIDPTKVYILGGVIDLGGEVGLTVNKAEKLGVTTMKLPVRDHLKLNAINSILCLNQVLAILLDLYGGEEWTKTIVRNVPSRKLV